MADCKKIFSVKLKDDKSLVDRLLHALAEMVGSAMMVTIGCSAWIFPEFPLYDSSIEMPVLRSSALCRSFGYGMGIAAVMISFIHISGGYLNPALSLCAFLYHKISLLDFAFYSVAQIAGGILGLGAVFIYCPSKLRGSGKYGVCCPFYYDDEAIMRLFVTELLGTMTLVFLFCALWDPRNKDWMDTTPLKYGGAVVACVCAFGQYSHAFMNPAMVIAPAILNNYWKHIWAFLVPEFIAGACVPLIYMLLFGGIDEE